MRGQENELLRREEEEEEKKEAERDRNGNRLSGENSLTGAMVFSREKQLP